MNFINFDPPHFHNAFIFSPQSGLQIMEPQMRGCTLWQVEEELVPGLPEQMQNHSGYKWILKKWREWRKLLVKAVQTTHSG